MPKVDAQHVERRRAQILEAAFHCFSERGFHRTTMRDIFEQASLSAGAVYGYFKSKDEILEALVERGRETTTRQLAALEPAADWRALLRQSIEALASERSAKTQRMDLLMWAEALNTPKLREIFVRRLMEIARGVATSMAANRSDESGSEPRAEDLARLGIALILGLSVMRTLDPTLALGRLAKVVEDFPVSTDLPASTESRERGLARKRPKRPSGPRQGRTG
jgi:AcrR family transcriptional regulator